ncbi:hypothetical protein KC799_16375 [candidate division KSB1 bacterium]|nr:hypothetical protein [candidate division KSB1 bacterium]
MTNEAQENPPAIQEAPADKIRRTRCPDGIKVYRTMLGAMLFGALAVILREKTNNLNNRWVKPIVFATTLYGANKIIDIAQKHLAVTTYENPPTFAGRIKTSPPDKEKTR